MTRLQEIEREIATLSRGEKAELAQTLVAELAESFPGVESIPGVSGGEPCIVRTRIPVWVLEQGRRQGLGDAELLAAYPTLRAEDLANAWTYVRSNRAQIEAQILENEAA